MKDLFSEFAEDGLSALQNSPGKTWAVLRFDGSCEDNGQPWATGKWSFHIANHDGKSIAVKNGLTIAKLVTNNVSEWQGLFNGLLHIERYKPDLDGLLIEGDSQLVIQTLIGRWNSRKPELTRLRDECRTLLHKIGVPWHARWIPREENEFCDSLT